MKQTSNDDKTVMLLQDLCQACLIIIERQLKDQLPGGCYFDPSEALQHQARSCSATNINGERNFAIADQIIYRAKNAKPSHVESKVMFHVNKTSRWLVEQDDGVQRECTEHAMSEARKNTKADKERREQLRRELQEKLRLSRQIIHQRESSAREMTEQWFELAYKHGGLWMSPGKIEDETRKLSMTSATLILKAQINIWTKVLKCAGDQISFTHATVDQLKEHLGKLIEAELPLESEDLSDIIRDPESLTGMYTAHQWADETHQRDRYYGQIGSFMNETSEFNRDENFPRIRGPRLPMFSESKDELDSYLQRFERYAVNKRWPRDAYVLNLASLLTGKALNVYSRLPLALANDYVLKKALLGQYQLTVDDYRRKFYHTKQNADENVTQYVSRLEYFLDSWIQLSEIYETFGALKEFLLQDQFLNSCPKELATFIREHSPSNLETMIDLANKFNLAHNAPSHEKERKAFATSGRGLNNDRDIENRMNEQLVVRPPVDVNISASYFKQAQKDDFSSRKLFFIAERDKKTSPNKHVMSWYEVLFRFFHPNKSENVRKH